MVAAVGRGGQLRGPTWMRISGNGRAKIRRSGAWRSNCEATAASTADWRCRYQRWRTQRVPAPGRQGACKGVQRQTWKAMAAEGGGSSSRGAAEGRETRKGGGGPRQCKAVQG